LTWDKKIKSNRHGYEDNREVLYKECSVTKFIDSDQPVLLCATFYKFIFEDEDSKKYLNHEATDLEIKKLCEDLQVMGRYDFKYLLKWRLKMIEFRDEVEDDNIEIDEEQTEKKLIEELKEEKDVSDLNEEELKREIQELKEKNNKYKKNLIKKIKNKRKKENAKTN